MILLKFFGSWFLAMGALALINDVVRANVPGGKLAFLSLRAVWGLVHDGSLLALQGLVQRSVHPLAWDPVLLALLKLPAWLMLAGFGGLLCYLGRRRRRVEIFSN